MQKCEGVAVAYKFTKEQVLKAIDGSYGIVSQVARRLGGCSWHTAEKHINRWEETRQAFADENERSLDHSEMQMIAKIENGDGPMIRFHLMVKGKHRGYAQREAVDRVWGGPKQIQQLEVTTPIRIILDT